jgi:hypothetical protein
MTNIHNSGGADGQQLGEESAKGVDSIKPQRARNG